MLSNILSSPLTTFLKSVHGLVVRWAYNFDGVDDRGQLSFRAINPDGDIDIEFRTGSSVTYGGVDRAVVSQCLTATYTSKEFTLYFNATNGGLQALIGGSYSNTATAATLQPNSRYRWQLIGTALKVWFNGSLVLDTAFTRGTARESSSLTVFGAQTHGATSTFRAFSSGMFYDLKINGVLYPMGEWNQPVQVPSPLALGSEVITQSVLENPSSKGSQWTYLGNGRWQLNGDGTYNELIFIAIQPRAYVLEFEVESISGGTMRCFSNSTQTAAMTNHLFNSVGKYRFVLSYPVQGAYQSFVRHSGTINCIIKNISFKPLWVANTTELLTNSGFDSNTSGWFTGGTGTTLSWASGQATINCIAGQASRMEQQITTLQAGAYYVATASITGTTGVILARLNIIRGAAGGYAPISNMQVGTGASQPTNVFLAPASDIMVQIVGDSTNAGTITVDNISLRRLDSLCNPMVLSNTTSDRWTEIEE